MLSLESEFSNKVLSAVKQILECKKCYKSDWHDDYLLK